MAAESKRLGKTVVTEVVPFTKWWPAEEYHQKYLEKGGQVRGRGGNKHGATMAAASGGWGGLILGWLAGWLMDASAELCRSALIRVL